MIGSFRKTYRNPGKDSSPYLPAILLGCALALMPLGILAQNAPAGPIAPGASSDQAASARGPAPAASSGKHPNFAGTWQLNKKQSDDPHEKMREARDGQRGGGGRWGGRGMGRGRRGQGQGNDMMKEYSKLTITQTDSRAKVTNESGRVLAFSSDGDQSANPPVSSDSNQSDSTERYSQPAQWQQDQLVVTAQTRGGSATRTYELSPDGKHLYLTTRIENPRLSQPVIIHFVYDPIKPSE
ncbi:MAG TPA: hypothetical protein VN788_05405 [Verrucomicrobiae bacterium]|nr:hypothetical protein [Verrucomicrobiae bacterium]